jgi:hypothetical protein
MTRSLSEAKISVSSVNVASSVFEDVGISGVNTLQSAGDMSSWGTPASIFFIS